MVAIQGLRVAAMPREEAGGRSEEEGRAGGERARARAPRLLAGTAARSEVARGAGRELLRARAAPAGRRLLARAVGSHRWFLPKVYRTSVRKAREHVGEGRFPETLAPAPHIVLSSRSEKQQGVWDPASQDVAQGLRGIGPRGGALAGPGDPRCCPAGKLREMGARTWCLQPRESGVQASLPSAQDSTGLFLGTARASPLRVCESPVCFPAGCLISLGKGPGRAQGEQGGGVSHSRVGWYRSLGGAGPGPRGARSRGCVLLARGASPDYSPGRGWVFWGAGDGKKREEGGKGRPPEEEDMLWSAPRERFREALWFGPVPLCPL